MARHATPSILLVCILLLAFSSLPTVKGSPTHAASLAPSDTPIPVVIDTFSDWTIADGLLYWSYSSSGNSYIRRTPTNGGVVRTLTISPSNRLFQGNVADSSGLYYRENGVIFRRPISTPYDPPIQMINPGGWMRKMALDAEHIYYAYFDPVKDSPSQGDGAILRIHKDDSSYETIATAVDARDLIVAGIEAYWVEQDGLWRSVMDCGALPCSKTQLDTLNGTKLLYYTPPYPWVFKVFTVDGGNYVSIPQSIRMSYGCKWVAQPFPHPPIYSCGTEGILYSPSSVDWNIGQMATNGTYLFWTETNSVANDGRLRRMPIEGGPVEDIVTNMADIDSHIFTDAHYVYFARTGVGLAGIYRLPFNASAILRDLAADAMEVTQGIQNLANDVPLVDNKATYVRAYGRSDSGPVAFAVEAYLYGTRNGNSLPGSPLSALNGYRWLQPGTTYNRDLINSSWLFRLPDSWTSAGTINLMVVVDARNSYSDSNLFNNTLSRNVTFAHKPPICTVFVPVRTHAPLYETPYENPNFGAMLDLTLRLWPTRDIGVDFQTKPVEEVETCLKWGFIPYLCYGPFELAGDSWKVLTSLVSRWAVSDDPDWCDAAGAETYYIGTVHPATSTNDDEGKEILGSAAKVSTAAWVKFSDEAPTDSGDFNWPLAGEALAHEMAHSIGRMHVDCGDPDDPDPDYPYPSHQIDFSGVANHYGFDSRTWGVIPPAGASDLMTYCASSWTSDYTWKGIMNGMNAASTTAQISLDAIAEVVLISGAITPSLGTAELGYAWVYPTGGLGLGIMGKLQSLAVAPGYTQTTALYHLQLLDDMDNVITDVPITLTKTIDTGTGEPVYQFMVTFPAPVGSVAQLRLLEGSNLLVSRTSGLNVPVVSIIKPAGGEIYGDEMLLQWQAIDSDNADELLYTVQYSPDNGLNWVAVVTDFPGPQGQQNITLSIDTHNLSGSGGPNGLIRVTASDGYHTGQAISSPFTMNDHPPMPYIMNPDKTQVIAAGQPVLLRGGSSDAEDGSLDGNALNWALGGNNQGSGEELLIGGMAPGDYEVVLTARDSDSQEATAHAALAIAPLAISSGTPPALDGFCDDSAYADATQVQLAPYAESGQATVQLLRSSNYFWACFSGVDRGAADPGASVGLRVDVDYSRDGFAQQDDYHFVVQEDGGYSSFAGNGVGGFMEPGPSALQAQVSASTSTWSAEMRVDAAVLGGWNHWSGIALEHIQRNAVGDDYFWPYQTVENAPDTWAQTALGTMPVIESIVPALATAGDTGLTLSITGKNFVSGGTARWNGVDLPTTFLSSSLLTATLSSAQLITAGIFEVTASDPVSGLVSTGVPFTVINPVPEIANLSPQSTVQGSPWFTLVVTGSNFVEGATVLWNGQPCVTNYQSGSRLTARIEANFITEARTISVVVYNPEPGGQVSSAASFTVNPSAQAFLGLIMR